MKGRHFIGGGLLVAGALLAGCAGGASSTGELLGELLVDRIITARGI